MEPTAKKDQILEAAVRRFAHFGIHKTSLTEIADDLGMTKQALAYYFPDKQSLSAAVEARVLQEFFSLLEQRFAAAAGLEEALNGLVEVKTAIFRKYAMLMHAALTEAGHYQHRVAESKRKVETRTVQMVADRLQQGIGSGVLKPVNAAEVSRLILDTLQAIEHCTLLRQVVPDLQAFADLCQRQKGVIHLMVNGLKEAAWKN